MWFETGYPLLRRVPPRKYQGSTPEGNVPVASQEICILWNPEVHCHVYKNSLAILLYPERHDSGEHPHPIS